MNSEVGTRSFHIGEDISLNSTLHAQNTKVAVTFISHCLNLQFTANSLGFLRTVIALISLGGREVKLDLACRPIYGWSHLKALVSYHASLRNSRSVFLTLLKAPMIDLKFWKSVQYIG
jgi:hypothetical protein